MSMYVLTSTVQMYVLKNRRSSHTDMKRRHPHAADESVCVCSLLIIITASDYLISVVSG